jgi:uncharacterized protein (DUF1810 family)
MYDEKKLNRFIIAQEGIYESVLKELARGEKRTHWIWFIFPQIKGLGHSNTSEFYGIQSLDEAIAYLSHPVLGKRLTECCELLIKIQGKRIDQILPPPDDLKLRSGMTLFSVASPETLIFNDVLKKYFNGARDQRTLKMLGI